MLISAGLTRRFVSFLYEILLLTALLLIAEGLFQGGFQLFSGHAVTELSAYPWLNALNFAWLTLVTLLYFGWCWIRGGQTLAMKTWRCRLLMQDGANLTPKAVLIRFVVASACYLPLLPIYLLARKQPEYQMGLYIACGLFVMPFIWALFDRDKQFIYDRFANTRTVFFPKEVPSKYAKPSQDEAA